MSQLERTVQLLTRALTRAQPLKVPSTSLHCTTLAMTILMQSKSYLYSQHSITTLQLGMTYLYSQYAITSLMPDVITNLRLRVTTLVTTQSQHPSYLTVPCPIHSPNPFPQLLST